MSDQDAEGQDATSTDKDWEGIARALLRDPATSNAVTTTSEVEVEKDLEVLSSIRSVQTVSADELDSAADREERADIVKLRRTYAIWLLWLLAGQLVFMNLILILSSTNRIQVRASVMQFYLAGTLGEIVSVVAISARFLFSSQPFLGKHQPR